MVPPLALVYVGLIACLLGTVIAALWLGNLPALTNAVVATLLAIAPSVLVPLLDGSSAPTVTAAPQLSVWIAGAAFLHTIGMFGPYDTVWWWDHLTHTLSATLLAALVYAILLVTEPRLAVLGDGAIVSVAGTVLCTLALGIVWEFAELVAREIGEQRDIDPVLEYYGLRDTALDLVFDALGALLVIALDLRLFVPIVERDPVFAGTVLTAIVVSSFVAVTVITVWLERQHPSRRRE
ncbi:hypothetical protein [Salinarchaeum laminariae]|uniref:hypothetical protein n=1 Tax=Salinarchaeum laminariae TaxID=869888 RepID=UPI0020BDC097|nr:hypothetical protein [Salinarchaeum laminariae]